MAAGPVNIVPFNAGMDSNCFMCKEKLRIEKDEPANPLTAGDADENQYFIDAKKIRVTTKNKVSGQMEKKEVVVHSHCMKQLEELKAQREAAKLNEVGPQIPNVVLGKRGVSGSTVSQKSKQVDNVKRQRIDGASIHVQMKQLIEGINQQ
tara:strand:+ start:1361 stop:1810 length:450 start_codon:yes stop_codon:yes gene_type:complete